MTMSHDTAVMEAHWGGGAAPFGASWQKTMMWIFIVTDALLFSGLLCGYAFLRMSSRTPWPVTTEVFSIPFIANADATLAGNTPGGDTDFAGGVLLVSGDGGTPPTDNTISGNLVLRNAPDPFWDETGSGNVFRRNLCRTSQPTGLCR